MSDRKSLRPGTKTSSVGVAPSRSVAQVGARTAKVTDSRVVVSCTNTSRLFWCFPLKPFKERCKFQSSQSPNSRGQQSDQRKSQFGGNKTANTRKTLEGFARNTWHNILISLKTSSVNPDVRSEEIPWSCFQNL